MYSFPFAILCIISVIYFSIEYCTVISMPRHRNSKNAQICLFCQSRSVSAEVLLRWGWYGRVLSEYTINSVLCGEKCTPDHTIYIPLTFTLLSRLNFDLLCYLLKIARSHSWKQLIIFFGVVQFDIINDLTKYWC